MEPYTNPFKLEFVYVGKSKPTAEDFIYATYTADKLKTLLDEHSKEK